MNKLNKKGVTLVELIVSFAIVGVAIIYFFQTLYTVKTIYQTAQEQTDRFVAKDYGLRIMDEYYNFMKDNNPTSDGGFSVGFDRNEHYFVVYYNVNPEDINALQNNDNFYMTLDHVGDFDFNPNLFAAIYNSAKDNYCGDYKSVTSKYYAHYNRNILTYNVLVCY